MLFGSVALFSLKQLIILSIPCFAIGLRKREFVFKLLRSNVLFVLGILFNVLLAVEIKKKR